MTTKTLLSAWGADIEPDQVLYQYDEPLIFSKSYGPFSAIFMKFWEAPNGVQSKYLASPITQRNLEAIAEGALSVRGAFLDANAINVLTTSEHFRVSKAETFTEAKLDEDVLPESGVPLFERFGEVPDAIASERSIFSVYFRGDFLSAKSASLGKFRDLASKTYSFLRRAFLPLALQSFDRRVIDFGIAEPTLGSLMFSVETLVPNVKVFNENVRLRDIDEEQLGRIFSEKSAAFIESLQSIKNAQRRGDAITIDKEQASLEMARAILPFEDSGLKDVFFSINGKLEDRKTIHLSTADVASIRDVYAKIDDRRLEISGRITEINGPSNTFIMLRDNGRQVTCVCSEDRFIELRRDESFKVDSSIRLIADYTQRPRRDLARVNRILSVGARASGGFFT